MTETKKTTRQRDLVEARFLEPVFNLLRNNGIPEEVAFRKIGYTNGKDKSQTGRGLGLYSRVDFYALQGLIHELKLESAPISKAFSLDFEECEVVFDALRKGKEIWPRRIDKIKALLSRVALHMSEL